ncbi:MAG: ABC transporter substrate-binding protein [Clostridiales bacterium]|nr:ABC transporter substrate-binding protein [Clostridiales bacterium]
MNLWMRKFLSIAVSAIMLGSIVACGNSSTPAPATQEPTAEATQSAAQTIEPATEPPIEPAEEGTDTISELPRNETLYFGGQQWGAVNGWNPFSADNNNALAVSANASSRVVMFETLYLYNILDGSMYPLLAEDQPEWNDSQTELTIRMNANAHWSDGTALTAEDVAYTWDTHVKYETPTGTSFGAYIESITAPDPGTVLIKAKVNEAGQPLNPLMILDYIPRVYVVQKAWTQALESKVGGDAALLKTDKAEDVVSSGPYRPYYDDDQKVVFIRDESYWGVAVWGGLPVPKYLAHTIYSDNAASQVAFTAGEIDVNQQFLANVENLWLKDGLPISTYMDEPPYGICTSTPSAWFNLKSYGLDQVAVRKAIAIAVDYDSINASAMTYQSPTFAEAPRSLMNPTEGEQAAYDHDAVADLQWVGKDIEGAKKLLDDAGIVDTDGDGYRELNGTKLSYNASCPNGWTDWQSSMEIVAAAGESIGIEITTNFPEWEVYQTVFTDGDQTEYDIFMYAGDGAGPTFPWNRVRQRLSSEFVGMKSNWTGNFGGYSNPEADEIIAKIPLTSDPDELKSLYTRAVEIYLTDVPSFALMYRPELFHAVNETVWTGFPEYLDGDNIPPTCLTDGYGIAGLYNLRLVS